MAILSQPNFTFEQDVRISDINYGGHLGYTQFIQLIHNARVAFLAHHGLNEIDIFGCWIVMLNTNVDYKAECFWGEKLIFHVDVILGEGANINFVTTAFKDNPEKTPVLSANDTMAFFNPTKRRLSKIPVEFRQLFEIKSPAS